MAMPSMEYTPKMYLHRERDRHFHLGHHLTLVTSSVRYAPSRVAFTLMYFHSSVEGTDLLGQVGWLF